MYFGGKERGKEGGKEEGRKGGREGERESEIERKGERHKDREIDRDSERQGERVGEGRENILHYQSLEHACKREVSSSQRLSDREVYILLLTTGFQIVRVNVQGFGLMMTVLVPPNPKVHKPKYSETIRNLKIN